MIDLFTRRIVPMAVSLRKGAPLTIQALWATLLHHPHPAIFHSDNGKEYEAKAFIAVLEDVGSRISRSHPGCSWENGYRESFYEIQGGFCRKESLQNLRRVGGGDLPDDLGLQPHADTLCAQDAAAGICRKDRDIKKRRKQSPSTGLNTPETNVSEPLNVPCV
jgi:transposase InsO family protein